jgi:hypothetical protein
MGIKTQRRLRVLGWTAALLVFVIVLPYVLMWIFQVHFTVGEMMHRMGFYGFVAYLTVTLACTAIGFGILWEAAGRHRQHASWPSGATASRKSAFSFLFAYFAAATAAANGISSWTVAAQSQVFIVLYLSGAFGIIAILGNWFNGRIGRSMMSLRLDADNVSADKAVTVLSNQDRVSVVYANGRIEELPISAVKDQAELSPFFDNIVSSSVQPDNGIVFLVSECGEVYKKGQEA